MHQVLITMSALERPLMDLLDMPFMWWTCGVVRRLLDQFRQSSLGRSVSPKDCNHVAKSRDWARADCRSHVTWTFYPAGVFAQYPRLSGCA